VFDTSALEAARRWRFTPGMKDGKPVEAWIQVPVDFRADGTPPETAN
jgi:TonB family protein